MNDPLRKEDIKSITQEMTEEILNEQRKNTSLILEKIDESSSEIIANIFSAKREIREEIGYQTIILKTLEDNLDKIQFGEDTGVSSNIELSVGGEFFGTGAKWVLNIDTGKFSYNEILEAIQLVPVIPDTVKGKAKSKLQKFFKKAN
jgi:hypothetical protein